MPWKEKRVLRLFWGLLFLLALAVSPLITLALLATIVVLRFPFRREAYGRTSVTLRGEVVRSAAEKTIADWFTCRGIRYVYERPALARWKRGISRPDFYLPDYDVYVEY